jgi:Domain of unknown function (DUF4333)
MTNQASTETGALFGCPVAHEPPPDTAGGTRAKGRRGKGYFVPGLIALVVMAAAGGLANFGGLDHSSPSHLAGSDVATFLAQGIQAQEGLHTPPSIACPATEPVRAGVSFTCQWQRSVGDRTVRVTETGRGQFHFNVDSSD